MSAAPEQTLCLVEDDPIMGESLTDRLTLEGVACDWYRDGVSALGALRSQPYAAVVSDVRLPDLDGLSVLEEIQSSRPGAPVILMTAFGTPETVRKALATGARKVVDKPFDYDGMLQMVTEVLGPGPAPGHPPR